jgi:hypothetical protein
MSATLKLVTGAALLVTALPVFAQDDSSSTTCEQMMAQAQPMVNKLTDQAKISLAQHVMANAKAALNSGNQAECKLQMQKVMLMTQQPAANK